MFLSILNDLRLIGAKYKISALQAITGLLLFRVGNCAVCGLPICGQSARPAKPAAGQLPFFAGIVFVVSTGSIVR